MVVGATLAPWFAGLPMESQAAASIAALAAGISAIARFRKPRFRRIAFRAAGWRLGGSGDVEHAAELVSHFRLGAWLVLEFQLGDRRRFRALLGPDNIDAETWRRLILLLSRAEVAQTG